MARSAGPNSVPALGHTIEAVEPSRALLWVGFGCASSIPLVLALGRGEASVVTPSIGLGAMSVLAFGVAALQRLPDGAANRVARGIGLLSIGLAAGLVACFFGPQTEISGLVSLGLMVLGVASTPGGTRLAWFPAWAGAVGLILGQIGATIAIRYTWLLGPGLVPPRPGVPVLGIVVGSTIVSTWQLFGFLAARRLRARYHALAVEVDEALRASVVREALLDEARHDYMRALAAARTGPRQAVRAIDASEPNAEATVHEAPWDELERTVREIVETTRRKPALDDIASADTRTLVRTGAAPRHAEPASTESPDHTQLARSTAQTATSQRWDDAYRHRLRLQQGFLVVVCALGIVAAYFILPDRVARIRAVVGLVLAAALALLDGWLARRPGKADVHWPWVLIAASGVIVASSYGLHSVIVGFVVVLMFLGGVFRGRDEARGINRRSSVLVSLCVSYFVTYVLLVTGVVEDHGLFPVRPPGMPIIETVIRHAILQGSIVAAYLMSGAIDMSFRRLREQSMRRAHEAAVQEALLETASERLAQLEAVGSEGLFAGQNVGRFTLRARRARGGMGEVYDAIDPETDEVAALKLVAVDVVEDPGALQQFAHEVTALRRVESPYVARVLDAGGLESGLPYVAMELIDGPSLAETLRQRDRLTREELGDLIRDVCAGLRAIHASGVVHRDVKPQNILRATGEEGAPWKIVDLGIALIDGVVRPDADLSVVGTPPYMAPEQFEGASIDARADLFAFSLILYRALTGRPAFGRVRVADDGRYVSPPSPRAAAAVSRDLELFLRIGCARRPDDRFRDVDELERAALAALDGTLDRATRARAAELLDREPWS
ncbi:MAG: serine/threonine-protein kinase [Sandaracinaceae bacterium]